MSLSACARCSKALGTSCCEVNSGEKLATLTWADVRRVAEVTGKSWRQFAEWEPIAPDDADRWQRLHPLHEGYFGPVPRRLTLRRKPERAGQERTACVFHDLKTGCTLDAEARPLACRLFPFVPHAGGWSLTVDKFGSVDRARRSQGKGCLAVEEAGSLDALAEALGTSLSALEALAVRTKEEARAHGKSEWDATATGCRVRV